MRKAAVGEDAFVDFEAHVAVGDRREIAPQAPGVRPIAAAHFEHVAKAARRDHADARALALEKRVGADGRAVDDRAHVLDRTEALQPLDESDRLVASVRRHLGDGEASLGFVEQEEVGEGAPDIDADDGRCIPGCGLKAGVPRAGSSWRPRRLRLCRRRRPVLFARRFARKIAKAQVARDQRRISRRADRPSRRRPASRAGRAGRAAILTSVTFEASGGDSSPSRSARKSG